MVLEPPTVVVVSHKNWDLWDDPKDEDGAFHSHGKAQIAGWFMRKQKSY